MQLNRRRVIGVLAAWPWLAACSGNSRERTNSHERFSETGLILVVDAVPGPGMEGVVFYDDTGATMYAKSHSSRRSRDIMALGVARVPVLLRAVWRKDPKAVRATDGGIDYEGPIIGDFTIPVAERIPDEVVNDIRANGGELRLKFRLKLDGILFGWDIERAGGDLSKFEMPGGDFLETQY